MTDNLGFMRLCVVQWVVVAAMPERLIATALVSRVRDAYVR